MIVHRGASEFAHENTLEAYRASLELGADGNEIDIRATRDGVLVCFHDDMLDHILDAFGDVGDYDWAELQTFPFRRPGAFGEFCRIPTLEEAFNLHRRWAGLMHLDIKRPGLERPIMALLDRLDLWDHVVAVNSENGPEIIRDPRCRPGRYKGSLYADRQEVNPQAIAAMLEKPGDMVIVDDPRGVLVALGCEVRRPSTEPVGAVRRPPTPIVPARTEAELLAILRDDTARDAVPQGEAEIATKSRAIRRRAEAAAEVGRRKLVSDELAEALEACVRQRSLSPRWMDHGLDGAMALRALAEAGSPRLVPLARFCLWRDDPAVGAVADPRWSTPSAWVDFRTKAIVFPLLERFPGAQTEAICRDYLALGDEDANRIGPPQFEAAATTLLAIRADEATVVELLRHRRGDVRGRAVLFSLSHIKQRWARASLEAAAPHALQYAIPDRE